MPDKEDSAREEKLRRAIRAEIERRDAERRREKELENARKVVDKEAELKRRIYREELRKYYKDRPEYREIIGDDGEPEWLLESDTKESEVISEVLEGNPLKAKKIHRYLLIGFIVILAVSAFSMIYFLSPGRGFVRVSSNVKGATIILDATPTDYFTDADISALPEGEHFITVEKDGYRIVSEAVVKVELGKGEETQVNFILVPDIELDYEGGVAESDSMGGSTGL